MEKNSLSFIKYMKFRGVPELLKQNLSKLNPPIDSEDPYWIYSFIENKHRFFISDSNQVKEIFNPFPFVGVIQEKGKPHPLVELEIKDVPKSLTDKIADIIFKA